MAEKMWLIEDVLPYLRVVELMALKYPYFREVVPTLIGVLLLRVNRSRPYHVRTLVSSFYIGDRKVYFTYRHKTNPTFPGKVLVKDKHAGGTVLAVWDNTTPASEMVALLDGLALPKAA